ncbi:MAG: hypothetical protein IT304_09525 [Dehalococcoidia bacterium]|nr:hypothetical protein [Dehalococcoidia bacterium]
MTAAHTPRASTSSAGDPVSTARSLGPTIRGLAPEIERAGCLPPELVGALRTAGLFHLMLPCDLGGSETAPALACRAIEEVSAADGSSGWCVMLAAQSAAFAGFMPKEHALAIWGDGGIVAGTARPIGRAVAVASPSPGYRVGGRWPFASGSSHASWFAAECVVYDETAPRRTDAGEEVTRMLFLPREAVSIHDTWDTTGLRGTASNDFSAEDVFVPHDRGFQMLVDPPLHSWPFYQALPLMFGTHGSQALGVGRAALEEGAAIARTKLAWGTDRPLAEQARFQVALADATAVLESARCFLYATMENLWDALGRDEADTGLLRSRVRLATSHAVRASVQAVDLMHDAVATTAIFRKSPLERHFRDIHTASAHVMVAPLTFEAAGRVELGLEPNFPFF